MAVGWVVTIAAVALVVGAGVGTLLTAVLIAAGQAQREGADTTCPSCSPSWDLAPGDVAGSAPADLQNP